MCGQAQDLPLQSFFEMELPKYFIKTHLTALETSEKTRNPIIA